MRNPTAADIARLQANWQASAKLSRTRQKVEAPIQETCSQFLGLDQWRRIKTDLPHLRGAGVQEPGIADDCFIRYSPGMDGESWVRPFTGPAWMCLAQVLWVEWKAPKTGKTSQVQHDWHALERARGAMTWKAGEDFDPTPEGFVTFYNASGLALVQRTIGAVKR